nr:unnamed protein product [Digitaria exilis]
MVSSAFRSTTRRDLHSSSSSTTSRSDPPPCPRRSRSRSVSAAPRARGPDTDSLREEDYANTRTNPLFDAAASPADSLSPSQGTSSSAGGGDVPRRDRGREPLKSGGRAGGGRARSVSVAPQRRHTASAPSAGGAGGAVGGRKASRARLVADHARPFRGSETDVESNAVARKLQSWRSRHSISEVCTLVCAKKDVVEIPLDLDTDAAELVSDMRIGQHWEQMEIPLEFDTDASDLVSEIWQHEANQRLEQLEAPLEFDPDTSGLAPDITEYTIKLKQSHERARKLRADLAVEEQREQELSRMLKGIVTAPNFTETHKKRPRRKSSIERLKVSRHLAEEAMNYFEECVSISTMDSTDFSSHEDPQSKSILNAQTKSNSRFSHKGRSSIQEPHSPSDQHAHHEVSELIFLLAWSVVQGFDKQTQCSISVTGSDASDSVIFSNTKAHLKFGSNSTEDLDGFDTPRSRSSCFSFTHEPLKNVENCDVRQYLGNFGRGDNMEQRETRSTYFADDYVSQKVNLDLLKDTATFQNRMQYGGLLICNIRTF